MHTLPPPLQSALSRELDEGEHLNWVGQPSFRILRKEAISAWLTIGFMAGLLAFLFLVLGLIEYYTPVQQRDDGPLGFFMTVGVIVMLWICSYWPLVMYKKTLASTTVYAITERRLIILRRSKKGVINERDYRADELIYLSRVEFPDGSGTLTIESARGYGTPQQVSSRVRMHAIHAVEDVIEVERLLRSQFGDA